MPRPRVDLGSISEDNTPVPYEPFVSKLGGRPAWLHPVLVPDPTMLQCGNCSRPLNLLLQIYTPDDEQPWAHHRVVYVFCCRNGACHRPGSLNNIKVLRSQLPRINPYYGPDAGPEMTEEEAKQAAAVVPAQIKPHAQLCRVCGLRGTKMCGKCKEARYCSKEHQAADWNRGPHRKECADAAVAKGFIDIEGELFPAREIISEPEELDDFKGEEDEDDDDDEEGDESQGTQASETAAKEDEEIQRVRSKINQYKMEIDDDKYEKESYEKQDVEVDSAFLKFQKIVEHYPHQVLRYGRVLGEFSEPLFVNDSGKPKEDDIPPCPLCKAPRRFEFQILSQMLNHIPIDNTKLDSLDWGTLIVYSCPTSCSNDDPDGLSFAQEFIWRQDFSTDGMGNRLRQAVLKPQEDTVVGDEDI